MNSENKVLIITASDGENLKLAKRFVVLAEQMGVNSTLIDLTSLELPLFSPKRHSELGIPSAITLLHSEMISISHWVVCAPEYNGSIPPVLTNAIAWLSVQEKDFRKLFNGRPIAMASVSGGGCMEVLISMRIQFSHLGAQVLGRQLASNNKAPAQDTSITDILDRLLQMKPLKIKPA
ncbi:MULTISPECIES: NAD(P)H-dependent oxidoreductase [Prochlorococcus]|uniref:Predicted flavoprotein n=1 Tax=Prochlorococcus marinus (strain SARG / CCMP1375 / SS120) TaxID=167539 RepID=Q7VEH0_PROMA|nr:MULTISPECIES: NAD(P)H-dependent oxidoreductase [Prochlorococcus]AAP99089.1 Predicted flavoprotein [Prochlorococcus marinus subsp. marinus str. CCMP1375]KGG11653.1 putative reductase [Prochlorococcus marinus str. LG]KGG22339.1 putative reductase [Prochlorococcus marinus str. SS2]KGG22674.1 putative reductase [Prochlorococcus marinus str. SS35]KGG32904.1 putative reductase [Prochlorococcus marinus str. SS51]